MKIAFDIGGVLSKYPGILRPLVAALHVSGEVQVFVISDMHPQEKICRTLAANGFGFIPDDQVFCSDYTKHGEMCKALLCEELGIDMLIDDHPGYLATGNHIRLLVMPLPTEPYLADEWTTCDEQESSFGRRIRPTFPNT